MVMAGCSSDVDARDSLQCEELCDTLELIVVVGAYERNAWAKAAPLAL